MWRAIVSTCYSDWASRVIFQRLTELHPSFSPPVLVNVKGRCPHWLTFTEKINTTFYIFISHFTVFFTCSLLSHYRHLFLFQYKSTRHFWFCPYLALFNNPPSLSCSQSSHSFSHHSSDIDQGQIIKSNLVTFIHCVTKEYILLLQLFRLQCFPTHITPTFSHSPTQQLRLYSVASCAPLRRDLWPWVQRLGALTRGLQDQWRLSQLYLPGIDTTVTHRHACIPCLGVGILHQLCVCVLSWKTYGSRRSVGVF